MTASGQDGEQVNRQARILEAVIDLLAREGISGVSMRAVAREGASPGLVNYHFEDKTSLIRAALTVSRSRTSRWSIRPAWPGGPAAGRAPRVREPEFLTTEYLSLRLQLWALARATRTTSRSTPRRRSVPGGHGPADPGPRPELSRPECQRRAADIDIVQNGVWLTALLGLDRASVRRSVARCEEIALGP